MNRLQHRCEGGGEGQNDFALAKHKHTMPVVPLVLKKKSFFRRYNSLFFHLGLNWFSIFYFP